MVSHTTEQERPFHSPSALAMDQEIPYRPMRLTAARMIPCGLSVAYCRFREKNKGVRI